MANSSRRDAAWRAERLRARMPLANSTWPQRKSMKVTRGIIARGSLDPFQAVEIAADGASPRWREGDADLETSQLYSRGVGTETPVWSQRVDNARVDDARVKDARVDNARVDDAHVDDAHVKDARVDDARVKDARV
ncbi:unnamed protein product [Lampetra planeri]